jgi:hypothetical protein
VERDTRSPLLTPVAFSHLSQRLIDDLSGEFMIFFLRLHQELVAKQKPSDHQGRRFATSPAEILFGEFPHRTSAGILIPALGTVGSPLPGCQTRFGVIPDVAEIVSR